jgi:uncharacterized membrane protein YgcG
VRYVIVTAALPYFGVALRELLYYTVLVKHKKFKRGGVRKPMDFSNRGVQPQTVAPSTHTPAAGPVSTKRSRGDQGKWARISVVTLAFAVVVVLLALVAVIAFGNNSATSESKYVDTSKLQAVFLNTGQVYFGNIKTLNNNYFVLTNIYYLQTTSSGTSTTTSSANTSVSLVKLGCELHQPYDQMVINRSQVTFWENLQSDGQVAKAVATFEKDNPNGQKCSDQSSSSSTGSSSTVQNANSNSSGSGTSTTNP